MKTKTKTPKVTKEVTKVKMDYKGMYESMKTLADNLSEELNCKSEHAFDLRGEIYDLEDTIEDMKVDSAANTIIWSVATFIVGILLGLYM
jgi:hypothetical protein